MTLLRLQELRGYGTVYRFIHSDERAPEDNFEPIPEWPALLGVAQAAQALIAAGGDAPQHWKDSRRAALVAALALLTTPPQTEKGDDSGESPGVEQ